MLSVKKLHALREDVDRRLERLPRLFEVLGEPMRLRILALLLKQKDLCVTEIAHAFDISVPAASQHLRMLEMAELVVPERHGQMLCYTVRKDDPTIAPVVSLILN